MKMCQSIVFPSYAVVLVTLIDCGIVVGADSPRPTIDELKAEVKAKERDVDATLAALASARAHLAKAEGKIELVVAEWQKAMAYHEREFEVLADAIAKGKCIDETTYEDFRGRVSSSRVWLAETLGKRDVLIAELPNLIAYHDKRTQTLEELLRYKAATENEVRPAIEESKLQSRRARERLAALQNEAPDRGKDDNAGKQ
jgi:hypothetical protein